MDTDGAGALVSGDWASVFMFPLCVSMLKTLPPDSVFFFNMSSRQ